MYGCSLLRGQKDRGGGVCGGARRAASLPPPPPPPHIIQPSGLVSTSEATEHSSLALCASIVSEAEQQPLEHLHGGIFLEPRQPDVLGSTHYGRTDGSDRTSSVVVLCSAHGPVHACLVSLDPCARSVTDY